MCIRNPAHCHFNSLPRLSNSISHRALAACPSSPKNTFFTGYQPRGHLVLVILRYGNVPASWNVSTTVRATQSNKGKEQSFVFLFSSLQSSKTAERRLTCFLMKRFLSYQQCSWFLSPSQAWLEGCRRERPAPTMWFGESPLMVIYFPDMTSCPKCLHLSSTEPSAWCFCLPCLQLVQKTNFWS